MRIGLLPFAPLDRPNGVNRYVNALTRELAGTEVVPPRSGSGRSARRTRRTPRLRPGGWRAPMRLDDYDVVHVPYERIRPDVSLRDRRVVATVMGLGGLTGANPVPEARRLDTEFVEAVRRLDRVTFITPSDATRRVLCDLVGVDASSVTVIPLGVDHRIFRPVDSAVPSPTTRPTSRPYLLHVGPYSVRKNSLLLLEAFAASRRDASIPHALVWAGPVDRRAVLGDAARLGLADHVVIAGPLSDAELADAYRGATALCVPSRYEGFGLPVLEAMACGTPVIVSDSPALVEVAGDAAVVVHTGDGPAELAAAIGHLAGSTTVRHELRAGGLARAASFTWTECAGRHAECYRDAAGRCDDENGLYSPPPR